MLELSHSGSTLLTDPGARIECDAGARVGCIARNGWGDLGPLYKAISLDPRPSLDKLSLILAIRTAEGPRSA